MSRESDLDALDDLLHGVRRLLQRPGYRQRFLTELGMPIAPGVLRVVRTVDRLGDTETCMGDLATALAVDASTVSRQVDQAVADGYLTRGTSAEDQRRRTIELTGEGRRLIERADAVRRSLIAEVTADWSGEDIRTLADLLGRLTKDLDRLEYT
jgi:DNA-binding MarR family transcriptional regulator